MIYSTTHQINNNNAKGYKMKYKTKDQNWADQTTTYWFENEDGEMFGIVEGGHDSDVIDCDGMPIDYNEQLKNTVKEQCIVTEEMRAE